MFAVGPILSQAWVPGAADALLYYSMCVSASMAVLNMAPVLWLDGQPTVEALAMHLAAGRRRISPALADGAIYCRRHGILKARQARGTLLHSRDSERRFGWMWRQIMGLNQRSGVQKVPDLAPEVAWIHHKGTEWLCFCLWLLGMALSAWATFRQCYDGSLQG